MACAHNHGPGEGETPLGLPDQPNPISKTSASERSFSTKQVNNIWRQRHQVGPWPPPHPQYTSAHTLTHICTHSWIYSHTHIHIYTHILMYVNIYAHSVTTSHTHTHPRTCSKTYTHYTHTHRTLGKQTATMVPRQQAPEDAGSGASLALHTWFTALAPARFLFFQQ